MMRAAWTRTCCYDRMRNNDLAQKKNLHRAKAFRIGYRFKSSACLAALILSMLLATSWLATAQTIPLGAADNVTILGASTVTNAGPTSVVGNLALSPGVSVTGFGPGAITNGSIQINNDLATQAHADAGTAYMQLVGETLTTDLSGQNLGGMILTPGIYHFGTTASLDGILLSIPEAIRTRFSTFRSAPPLRPEPTPPSPC